MCILQLKASRFSLFCAIPNNRRWVGNIQRGGFAARAFAAADLPRRAGIREEGDMI